MKFIFKTILLLIFFVYSLLYFVPKELAYYKLEEILESKKVIISQEQRIEKPFSFELKDGKIYFNSINVASFEEININTLVFKNQIQAKNIKLFDSLKNMFPPKINELNVTYTFLDFDKVQISGNGDFGAIEGHIDIIKRVLIVNLKATPAMKRTSKNVLKMMKQTKEGYIYEYKF